MPVYWYKAATSDGTLEGYITADSPADGRTALRKRGLAVKQFREQHARRVSLFQMVPRFASRASEAALNEFVHYVCMLLRAGVPLSEALAVVIRQAPRGLEPALRRVTERVNAGSDLAEAMSQEGDTFDSAFIGVVRVGQASGQLEPCLGRLISLRRREQQLRQRIAAVLAYPLIVSTVGLGVVVFLLTFVVPKITALITQSGRTIPVPTQILLAISGFLRSYGLLMIVTMLVAGIVLVVADRRRRLLKMFQHILMRMPVIGPFMLKAGIAQAATLLETMLSSGLPLDEAIEITRRSLKNPMLDREFEGMLTALRSGQPLVESSRQGSALPPVVAHVLAVGDQTGQLEEMLGELASSFDEDVEVAARQAIALLEPAMIISISIIVGFIVLATILPIIRISGSF